MVRPIFYDPSGRRRNWTRRGLLSVLCAVVIACAIFATTVVSVPAGPPVPFGLERITPLPFRAQVSKIKHGISRLLPWHAHRQPPTTTGHPLTIAFYTSWSDQSTPSLARHIDQIDWVAPTLLQLAPDGGLVQTQDAPMRRVIAGSLHRPLVVPVLQNALNGSWNGAAAGLLLKSPQRRHQLVASLEAMLDKTGDGGVIYDFEDLPKNSLEDLVRLVDETRISFAPHHRVVAVTMPVDDPSWPAAKLARAADQLILMAYDEHWQGGQAGPIASDSWFASRVASTMLGVPAGKAVIALGNYGYDWHDGHADSLTVEEAWLAAHDSGTKPMFDRASGNLGFSYLDDGARHDIWMLDAATSWNQMQMLSRLGLHSVALWRLGSEDPGFWSSLKSWRNGHGTPDLTAISQQTNVDVEGQGEILRVSAEPQSGSRSVSFAPGSTLISQEQYNRLPTPYVVSRTGARDKMVSLTFDDGPDPKWTPQILSILERYHVPATFFIVGENGVTNPGLLSRIVADGNEIGNHSYTHPNMADEAKTGIGLELNATQRLIEAFTGRSTRLFRAPYFGDAEPTTPDELIPALIAQQKGYTVVGLHVDPGDWKRPGAQAIVDRTLQQVYAADADRSANVILLHDGGGDRSQTVAALPGIITGLQKAGYRIVPTSTLAGLSRDQVMPRISGADLLSVRADVALFTALDWLIVALDWTFFFAIALGMARAVGMTLLALRRRREAPRALHSSPDHPLVSVIIPAYNEERVIEASVERILNSDYPNIEVIVADDGSKDRTSALVAKAYGSDPRVTLLTLENGGKAAALNRALTGAKGAIIVALDADTQFEKETISRLVRWFADTRIGAVAGNAKVGNRVNLVTRWQAVEYVTAQNIERRALTRFDAIMVVPGAVGAWRRAALDEVGGYPENTLAEDQDLTIAIQRRGWKIAYDEDAVAWTEAPETFKALSKQRYRWSFGTLQCLWKHRKVLRQGHPSGLAFIGIPQAWLFQILFAVISPAIDLALGVSIIGTAIRVMQHGWAQTQTDVLRMAFYWAAFTGVDLACGWIAFRLDTREKRFPALLLLAQRLVYRQLMYSVVIRSIGSALAGLGVGWGKLERTGRVNASASSKGNPDGGNQPTTVLGSGT
ncbi:glycosyltransferase [Novosphingobium taihuense]|uniref:Beta-monoglucosyldiacylglycerol synthase n=1 Tax=Novosphingobium taihuense TaxID=260085 RepID=A0A7W7A924_9SPHN|nr:glycosyltransferase [Novosphingobium taihuense]MBB4611937.1 peptidoglycan/xylan/chitin deacetylase (PgdA/CDA1 family)/spore germination protein YaaH/GT2 family glycosyltransferase [Novosphingobium taihuense]TWH88710.1 cellulose synthase/poly-beta-1,6-N-acetylglucosamine synthase-like glycosyltransferase [Novosphingobium taihuense]